MTTRIPYNHEIQDPAERHDLAITVTSLPKENTLDTIERLKSILQKRQAARVKGILVDTFSAKMIMTIYDNLSPEKKEKFATKSIKQMMAIACKYL